MIRANLFVTPHACKPRNRFSFWIWNLYNCVPALFYHTQSPHKTVRNSKSNTKARVRGPIQILVPGNSFWSWNGKQTGLPEKVLWQRTQLKSGTVCTVLLGTQFYAFQIQNEKRGKNLQAWGVISGRMVLSIPLGLSRDKVWREKLFLGLVQIEINLCALL